MNLQKEFEKLVTKYLDKLLEGTEYKLDFWVADIIGGVAAIYFDVYIGFDDIRYCVDNDISIDRFSDYQDWTVEEYYRKSESIMNFKNWLKMNKS